MHWPVPALHIAGAVHDATHVPLLQQPPLQCEITLHDVEHLPKLHA